MVKFATFIWLKFDVKLYVAIFLSISWHVKEMNHIFLNAWNKFVWQKKVLLTKMARPYAGVLPGPNHHRWINEITSAIFQFRLKKMVFQHISTKKYQPRKFLPTRTTRFFPWRRFEGCLSYVLVVPRRDCGSWSHPRDLQSKRGLTRSSVALRPKKVGKIWAKLKLNSNQLLEMSQYCNGIVAFKCIPVACPDDLKHY